MIIELDGLRHVGIGGPSVWYRACEFSNNFVKPWNRLSTFPTCLRCMAFLMTARQKRR